MNKQKSFENVENCLQDHLSHFGFQVKAFSVQWYNETVGNKFKLPYCDNTVAFIVVSLPSMFERTFLPYYLNLESPNESAYDILDSSVNECIQNAVSNLDSDVSMNCEVIFDYSLHPNRRPKVLVQSAGHVAGVCHFYQRSDIPKDLQPWTDDESIYGCALHPEYGGWFALRAVVILPNLQFSNLPLPEPIDPLNSRPDLIIDLLEKFNRNWKDGSYRDVIPVKAKYSHLQRNYFETEPINRKVLLSKWKSDGLI